MSRKRCGRRANGWLHFATIYPPEHIRLSKPSTQNRLVTCEVKKKERPSRQGCNKSPRFPLARETERVALRWSEYGALLLRLASTYRFKLPMPQGNLPRRGAASDRKPRARPNPFPVRRCVWRAHRSCRLQDAVTVAACHRTFSLRFVISIIRKLRCRCHCDHLEKGATVSAESTAINQGSMCKVVVALIHAVFAMLCRPPMRTRSHVSRPN